MLFSAHDRSGAAKAVCELPGHCCSAQNSRYVTGAGRRGAGERQLRVSYISEVPVWKSTYRIVFPRMANGNATMQGWAVVDNTVARTGTT